MDLDTLGIVLLTIEIMLAIVILSMKLSLVGYIAERKTDKFLFKVYFNNPRRFSLYYAISATIVIALLGVTASVYQFYDGNYTIMLLLVIITMVGAPYSAWRIYHSLINLGTSMNEI